MAYLRLHRSVLTHTRLCDNIEPTLISGLFCSSKDDNMAYLRFHRSVLTHTRLCDFMELGYSVVVKIIIWYM